MEYLDRAGELFSRLGAKLYVDQVLEKKEALRAYTVPSRTGGNDATGR